MIEKISELFHRYGIKSVTMDDVARELSISKKTLYEQFEDKSGLIRIVIEHEFSCQKKKFNLEDLHPNNALEEVFLIFKHYSQMLKEQYPSFEFDLKKYYPEIYADLKTERRKRMLHNTLENIVRGKEEGLYRSDLHEQIIAKLNVLRIECLIDSDLFSNEELFSQEFALEMFLYHLHGIVSEKGSKFLEQHIQELKNIG